MTLANGAVQLPLSHLSVRVPWHDLDWTGRVCAAPGANHACTVLRKVIKNKDADAEEAVAGFAWKDIENPERLPELAEHLRSPDVLLVVTTDVKFAAIDAPAMANTGQDHEVLNGRRRVYYYDLGKTIYEAAARNEIPHRRLGGHRSFERGSVRRLALPSRVIGGEPHP